MDTTTTGALRVVLNVTEVSAVAEMERMRTNNERMMKSYHFRESMKQWCYRFMCFANRFGPHEDHDVEDNPGGLWYRIEVGLPHWLTKDNPDFNFEVVGYHHGFAAGDLTFDAAKMEIIIFDYSSNADPYVYIEINMDNLEVAADFFDAHPGVYEAFMDQINPDYFDHMIDGAEYGEPVDGSICV